MSDKDCESQYHIIKARTKIFQQNYYLPGYNSYTEMYNLFQIMFIISQLHKKSKNCAALFCNHNHFILKL